jgi:plastocyanin
VLVVAASASTLRAAAAADSATGTHQVVIQGLQNVPATLTVKRGDVVVWTNKDPFPHTVTAPGVFDSKSIAEGKSWRYKADRVGSFEYICTLHSNMKGKLRVE